MSIWRRLLKFPWIVEKTNKSFIAELEGASEANPLEKCFMGYFGHMARKNEENLQIDILFGKVHIL